MKQHDMEPSPDTMMLHKPEPPSSSWWIGPPETFTERHQQELARITASPMAKTLHPPVLGLGRNMGPVR